MWGGIDGNGWLLLCVVFFVGGGGGGGVRSFESLTQLVLNFIAHIL